MPGARRQIVAAKRFPGHIDAGQRPIGLGAYGLLVDASVQKKAGFKAVAQLCRIAQQGVPVLVGAFETDYEPPVKYAE